MSGHDSLRYHFWSGLLDQTKRWRKGTALCFHAPPERKRNQFLILIKAGDIQTPQDTMCATLCTSFTLFQHRFPIWVSLRNLEKLKPRRRGSRPVLFYFGADWWTISSSIDSAGVGLNGWEKETESLWVSRSNQATRSQLVLPGELIILAMLSPEIKQTNTKCHISETEYCQRSEKGFFR